MKIHTIREALEQVRELREFVRSGLPTKVSPNGHSPDECALLNALTGIQLTKDGLLLYCKYKQLHP